MKKTKLFGSITVVALIVIAITVAVIGYGTNKKTEKGLLTLKTIEKTFQTQGVLIEEDKSKSSKDFELNGNRPDIYNIEKDNGTLLVYMFKSIGKRQDIVYDFFEDIQGLGPVAPFEAKNVYLVYMAPVSDDGSYVDWKSVSETKLLISDIVFKYLNEGKEVVYIGESTSWIGTYTLKYHENFWDDETGKLNYESNHQGVPEIQYKMKDIEDVGPIEFEYKTNSGGGSSKGLTLKKDGYSNFGSSGGSGSFIGPDQEITFIIKWNGMEENMILKAE